MIPWGGGASFNPNLFFDHQKILKYFIAGVHRQNNNKSY